jgi:hypothetical protein
MLARVVLLELLLPTDRWGRGARPITTIGLGPDGRDAVKRLVPIAPFPFFDSNYRTTLEH